MILYKMYFFVLTTSLSVEYFGIWKLNYFSLFAEVIAETLLGVFLWIHYQRLLYCTFVKFPNVGRIKTGLPKIT